MKTMFGRDGAAAPSVVNEVPAKIAQANRSFITVLKKFSALFPRASPERRC
jgi:hypothetical protein